MVCVCHEIVSLLSNHLKMGKPILSSWAVQKTGGRLDVDGEVSCT